MSISSAPLTGWRKVVFASPQRKSRFHSESGKLMPASAWVRMPWTLSERILRLDRKRPWLVPSAVDRLRGLMWRDWRVFELGAGASTGWLAARSDYVLSCETDPEWFKQVIADCPADVRLMDVSDLLGFIQQQPPATFDLVVIDCLGERMPLLEVAAALVKPGSYLLLDNSDRFPGAAAMLPGWTQEAFIGVLPSPFCAQETSIFRRPSEV